LTKNVVTRHFGREGRHEFGRLLVVLLALVLSGTGVQGCSAASQSAGNPSIHVVHYDLDLQVDRKTLEVVGRADLTIARSGVDVAKLILRGPTVRNVLVNGRNAEFSVNREVIAIPLTVPDDTVGVLIHYAGIPSVGLYQGVVSGREVVYTDGWPTRVAGWLPGTHHPSTPATIEMRIRASSGTIAASGRILAEAPGEVRVTLDQPAPTYSFAFAIADFDTSSTGPHRHYHFGNDRGLTRTESILEVTARLIGPYPYASFSTVAVPFGFAGMENATAAFLNADLYRAPEQLEQVLIHEIVHQWLGNSVTIADWPDLWISEGITTYLSTIVLEQLDGVDAGREAKAEMARLDQTQARRAPPIVPQRISDPSDMLSWVVYRKAGSMLHALRLMIGDEAFFSAIRTMYRERPVNGLSTQDAIALFESESERDLTSFFNYWLRRTDFPRLSLEWNSDTQVLAWSLAEEGSLDNVDFELEIESSGEIWYVNRSEESIQMPGVAERPQVRSVGVMLDVRWK
jgi:aminopeptidase N